MIDSLEKLECLEHLKRQKEYAAKTREKARHDALAHKVGEIVLNCWPWVGEFKVRRTKAENEAEFAPLRDFLLQVAADEKYTTRILSLQRIVQQDKIEAPNFSERR